MRLIYLALMWCGGILIAAATPAISPVGWILCAFTSLVAAAFFWKSNRWLGIILVGFTLGGLRLAINPSDSPIAAYNDTGGMTIEGVVISPPDQRETFTQVRVAAENVTRAGETVPISGIVLIRAPLNSAVQYGDHILATGSLISPYIFDRFNYADYLARSGVYSLMTNAAIEVVSSDHGQPLFTGINDLRQILTATINTALPEPMAGLLNGILLGDESQLAPTTREAFAITGAAHIIAVSGFNMIVIAQVVQGILRSFHVRRVPAAVIALLVVGLYTLLTGATPAILRAALMSALLITGEALRRKTFVPTSLAFAVLVISLLDPFALWDVGFQLSFFAALALASFNAPISQWLNRRVDNMLPLSLTRVSGIVTEPLATTLAVQIAVIPLIGLYFGQISLIAPLVSILIVPIQPVLMILGSIAALIGVFAPQIAQILFWIDGVLLSWTIAVVRWCARLPFASVAIDISPRLVALFFLVWIGGGILVITQPERVALMFQKIRSRPFVSAAIGASLCLIVLMGAKIAGQPDGQLHVWFLDVNGSNAVLAQTPGGAQILIDGGSAPSRLLTAVGDHLPFDDRTIEIIAVTQPDTANYAALNDVLERYDAGVILTSGQPNLSDDWAQFTARAGDRILPVTAGYTVELSDGTLLEVLSPSETPALQDDLDDSSLALRLSYGNTSFLLPGDMSREAQSALAGTVSPVANVIQIPRHGQENSLDETLLMAVQSQAAVIQSDGERPRDDPAPQTLALLNGLSVFDTAQGAIHFWTDGSRLWAISES
jgi:competence protein ComEC